MNSWTYAIEMAFHEALLQAGFCSCPLPSVDDTVRIAGKLRCYLLMLGLALCVLSFHPPCAGPSEWPHACLIRNSKALLMLTPMPQARSRCVCALARVVSLLVSPAQSEHHTLDPEQADYFYVPVYTSCFIHPVWGFVDHPWYYGPTQKCWEGEWHHTLRHWRWAAPLNTALGGAQQCAPAYSNVLFEAADSIEGMCVHGRLISTVPLA